MSDPITCHGNDLAQVCAGLRERGGVIEAMDVTGVASYSVNYFERVAEESQSVPGRTRNAGHAVPDALTNFERGSLSVKDDNSTKDKQQVSENHIGNVATVPGLLLQDTGRARNAMTRKASEVCAEPVSLIPSIEARIALIQSKAVASGRVRKQPRREYRSPYSDT